MHDKLVFKAVSMHICMEHIICQSNSFHLLYGYFLRNLPKNNYVISFKYYFSVPGIGSGVDLMM